MAISAKIRITWAIEEPSKKNSPVQTHVHGVSVPLSLAEVESPPKSTRLGARTFDGFVVRGYDRPLFQLFDVEETFAK